MTGEAIDEQDLEPGGAEVRVCAICGHDESEHEKVELGSRTPRTCRACDDEHDFEPEPDLGVPQQRTHPAPTAPEEL